MEIGRHKYMQLHIKLDATFTLKTLNNLDYMYITLNRAQCLMCELQIVNNGHGIKEELKKKEERKDHEP